MEEVVAEDLPEVDSEAAEDGAGNLDLDLINPLFTGVLI